MRGEWTEEDRWASSHEQKVRQGSLRDTDVAVARDGCMSKSTVSQGADTFPLADTRYLYSSLSALRNCRCADVVVAVHRYVLWTLIVLVVAGVGLGLSTQTIGVRLWWLAALIVAVVL